MNSTDSYKEPFRDRPEQFSGEIKFDEPLAKYTYYKIGGNAAVFASPKRVEDLHWLAERIIATGIPFFILGAGSNVLVPDDGFPGLVVRTSKLNLELFEIPSREPGRKRIRAGASLMISTLLRRAAQEGWAGFERLTGIPGTVGGAAFMNAGTHLGETAGLARRVEVFPLVGVAARQLFAPMAFEGVQLDYEYRRNHFIPQGSVVWAVEWEASVSDPAAVKRAIDETLARRKETQPLDSPSCGSVFKNPKEHGLSAWQVIERLGLRGRRIGDAQFSEKHSNFIVNLGGAKAVDVSALIDLAKEQAKTQLGIDLREEVVRLGAAIPAYMASR